jgi:hypothetical protein
MTEQEMEDLLWEHAELLLKEPLQQYQRQQSSGVSRADLVLVDSLGRLLVIEVKKGVLPRGAIPQALDHFGSIKSQNPDKIVETMVVANRIPAERKATLENYQIEWREISERRFREVAADKGYIFRSEQMQQPQITPPPGPALSPARRQPAGTGNAADGWVKVVWKDDCKDARRKGDEAFRLYGEYLNPGDIIGKILSHLSDQQVHSVHEISAAVGGSASIKERIKHVAHRGNCLQVWEVHRSPDWQYVRLTRLRGSGSTKH